MQVLRSVAELSALEAPAVLCAGVFDGVHLGHQSVILRAMELARDSDATLVVVTFDPHPARVLRPESAPRLLTSLAHKQRLIEAFGVGVLLVVGFDQKFAAQPPEQFIGDLSAACQDLRWICIGHDWAFGKGRRGNAGLLRELGADLEFRVEQVAPALVAGEPVSSTRIRHAIQSGDFEGARALLGRDYTILGTVEQGRQLGRTLGFPTANLRAHNEQFPPDGVYAVRCDLGGKTLDGVANIGMRPTVEMDVRERKLEVHLLDWNQDIYGQDLEVTFVQFLRPEQKFDGVRELAQQITQDVAAARSATGSS